jgi:hypothetical protein
MLRTHRSRPTWQYLGHERQHGSVALSEFYGGNAGNEVFRDYSPGPPSGVGTDPDAVVAQDFIETRAKTALTLGVLSLAFGVVTGLPAVWVGRRALLHIEASEGDLRGRGLAWVGIALGCLGIVLTIVAWVYLHQHPSSHPRHATRVP